MDMDLLKFGQNQPKIYYENSIKNDKGEEIESSNLTLIIELGAPANFYEIKQKFSKDVFKHVKSPLRLENDLLNYWNLRQVIYVSGIKNSALDEVDTFKKLLEQELISSFEKIPPWFDLTMDEGEIVKVIDQGMKFEDKIEQLAMPLRFSLMSPISFKKISIFEP